ncbi:carbohydrate ABC transporter permease [Cohnella suwonensis]|uniref:Carbohydrate ABC transporter permease n=1 Tax=Cohnella suwonensis TaxID=696072 RepID=A0ABW0LZ78_9BACL
MSSLKIEINGRYRRRLPVAFTKHGLLIAIAVIVLVPLATLLFAAFKTTSEITSGNPLALPNGFYFDNLISSFRKADVILSLKNTSIIGIVSVLANMIIGSMLAYIIARFDFRFKRVVLALFVFGIIVPFYTTEIARFGLIKDLGIYNSLLAPILIYTGADMVQIFIYKQFMDKIPVELDEAAMMEGASYFKIYWKIIFPLVLPASATLAIIKFVDIANDMYIPYLYIPSEKFRTLSTSLMLFYGDRTLNWAGMSAGILWIMLPTIIVYFFLQRYIFAGLVAGAVKE